VALIGDIVYLTSAFSISYRDAITGLDANSHPGTRSIVRLIFFSDTFDLVFRKPTKGNADRHYVCREKSSPDEEVF
jgi:hypothetical protein